MRPPFRTAALVGLLSLSAAQAQYTDSNSTESSNSTAPAATGNNGTNPLIPTAVSEACQNFLADLNGDKNLTACTQPVLDVIGAVDPASGASSADVATLLNQTCSASGQQSCSDSYIRTLLSNFAGNCSAELVAGGNAVVAATYDVVYMMQPFRQALCSVDSTTKTYCISELASGTAPSASAVEAASSALNGTGAVPTSTGLPAAVGNATVNAAAPAFNIQTYAGAAMQPANLFVSVTDADAEDLLNKRDDETAAAPNATTFRLTNLPFLFLSSNMTSSYVCTQCTKTILLRYLQWESSVPYVSGLASSALLGGQSTLWSGLSTTCGSGFTESIAAGSGTGSLGGAMSGVTISTVAAIGAALLFGVWGLF